MVIIKKEHKNRSHVKQHYVPQSYLKNFANVKDTDVYWIYCFDKTKKEKNIYPSNIKNISQEKYFNENNSKNIENSLSKIEYKCNNSINSIIKCKGKYKMLRNENIRFDLAMFILIQFIRTLEARRYSRDCIIQIKERVKEIGLKLSEDIQDQIKSSMKKENIKSQHINLLESVMTSTPERESFLFCLMGKKWFLIENKTEINFWTSDNPVVLNNSDGRMGLLADNMHIYLPLTPKLCLGLLDGCNIYNISHYLKNNKNFHSDRCKIKDINKINKFNKLQAVQSTRHIFSKEEEDLFLIKELIDKGEVKKDSEKERIKSEITKIKDNNGKEHTYIHLASYDLN